MGGREVVLGAVNEIERAQVVELVLLLEAARFGHSQILNLLFAVAERHGSR